MYIIQYKNENHPKYNWYFEIMGFHLVDCKRKATKFEFRKEANIAKYDWPFNNQYIVIEAPED